MFSYMYQKMNQKFDQVEITSQICRLEGHFTRTGAGHNL